MSLRLVQGDICKQKTDVIVNAANSDLLAGGGVCGAIFAKAGMRQLQKACDKIGHCDTGSAVATPGFDLCPYIIHAVGPIWRDGKHNEKAKLEGAYRKSLELADELKISSISFPLISAGIYGYPKAEALQVAVDTITTYLQKQDSQLEVNLVIYDQPINYISSKQREILAQLDDSQFVQYSYSIQNMNESRRRSSFFDQSLTSFAKPKAEKKDELEGNSSAYEDYCPSAIVEACYDASEEIEDITPGKTFHQILFELIDEKELLDTEVYQKSNIDRKIFSKLRGETYHPSKKTVLALLFGLKADMEEATMLLESAGYAFAPGDLTDQIVKICITRKIYHIGEVNELLFFKGQKTLGC